MAANGKKKKKIIKYGKFLRKKKSEKKSDQREKKIGKEYCVVLLCESACA